MQSDEGSWIYNDPFKNTPPAYAKTLQHRPPVIHNFSTQKTSSNSNNDDIEKERAGYMTRGLSGLENIGNTCYMNSILQCLALLVTFSSWLRKNKFMDRLHKNIIEKLKTEHRKNPNEKLDISQEKISKLCEESIVYNLAEVFKKMWDKNCTVVPKTLKMNVSKLCPTFSGATQNDSQELLIFLLDRIHEETKSNVHVLFPDVPNGVLEFAREQKKCMRMLENPGIKIDEKENIQKMFLKYRKEHIKDATLHKAYTFWKKHVEKSHSVITDLFTGLYYSRIRCKECGMDSGSFEPFTIFSIPTKDHGEVTLDECIEKFSETEVLSGDNQYFCQECNKKVDAEKRMFIWEPPEILIIQLKRFKNDQWRTTKTESKVVFPIDELDLKHTFSDLRQIENGTYDLWAISEHKGSCNFGHYIAYCKNALNDCWYQFNDSDVVHIPRDDLAKEVITKNAYIMFYVRRNK